MDSRDHFHNALNEKERAINLKVLSFVLNAVKSRNVEWVKTFHKFIVILVFCITEQIYL